MNEQERVEQEIDKLLGPKSLEARVSLLEAEVKHLRAEIVRLEKLSQPVVGYGPVGPLHIGAKP